jgi:hypothetical protein
MLFHPGYIAVQFPEEELPMLLTIEGTYKEGKIELLEIPTEITHAKVLVTFLPTVEKPELRRSMRYGQFAGEALSTEADFRMAEWRGETNK